MQPMATRLVILALIIICGVGLYFIVDTIETGPLRQAQQTAQDRVGTDLINLCHGATATRGTMPSRSKMIAINSDNDTVYDIYDSALPVSLKATDKSDVEVLLCLQEDKAVYDTSEYGDPTKYTCTEYERDLTGYLVDVKTGKTLNYKKFRGQRPPECPDSTDTDVTRTGDVPLAKEIISWLTGNSGREA